MWYQNVQNFIPIIPQAESSEAVPNINEIWRPPLRSQGDGQGCWFEICRGGGGWRGFWRIVINCIHMYNVRYLLLPLSHCPTPHVLYAYFLPLTLWHHPRETPSLPPPPHQDVKHSLWMGRGSGGWGSVGVEVWRQHSHTRFWGKENIRVKGKGRHFFRKSSLRRRFLSITKDRNRLLRCQG